MKKLSLTLLFLFTLGCESFVENATSPISYVNDDDINNASNIPFLINGVLNNYILDNNSSQITVNVINYTNGFYTVALVCNGQIVDVKTLIKQYDPFMKLDKCMYKKHELSY